MDEYQDHEGDDSISPMKKYQDDEVIQDNSMCILEDNDLSSVAQDLLPQMQNSNSDILSDFKGINNLFVSPIPQEKPTKNFEPSPYDPVKKGFPLEQLRITSSESQ